MLEGFPPTYGIYIYKIFLYLCSEYRVAIEKLVRHRLAIVQKEDDLYEIENQISCGQVEELIQHVYHYYK
jgi:hypothetical protein